MKPGDVADMGRSAAVSRILNKRRAGPGHVGQSGDYVSSKVMAPQAQAPQDEEVHAPGRGSASKFTDEAEMSELLLQGVRASVVQRSSHLSKDVAAFSKIRW